jgi:Glycoside hydrolase family 44
MTRIGLALLVVAGFAAAACSGSDQQDIQLDSVPSTSAGGPSSATTPTADTVPGSTTTTGTETGGTPAATDAPLAAADVTIALDPARAGPVIQPEIYGVTSNLSAAQLQQAGMTVNSWGGNPVSRYNFMLGNAFNTGADGEFRNTSFGFPAGDQAQRFTAGNAAAGVKTRLAIPTLGWVAKNADDTTCSFPTGGGGCAPASEAGNCSQPKLTTDPNRTSVASTPAQVASWLTAMAAAGAVPDYVAMDNEPELWGVTHYDVHPKCPTYEEILDKFLAYAPVVREALPTAAITGPVACCWYDYWRIAPGPADGSGEDYISWFLDKVKAHDDQAGARSLDYLDVHYYPQGDLYNDNDDAETDARRLRSTQSLFDPAYKDESWITEPIQFVPRMKQAIAEHYPGTKLFISEWNFGNDKKINGALAIADVLGIFGQEGVDAATYYRNPEPGSPGSFAFTMFGNYDGKGGRFVGTSIAAASTNAADDRVGAYAALDQSTGVLRVVLVNRDPTKPLAVGLDTGSFHAADQVNRYEYGPDSLNAIRASTVSPRGAIRLPAASITMLVLEPAS